MVAIGSRTKPILVQGSKYSSKGQAAGDQDGASPSENVVWRNIRVLRLAGVWRPEGRCLARLYPLYFGTVCTSMLHIGALAIFRSYTIWGDMTEVTFALVSGLTCFNGAVKMIHHYTHSESYYRLVNELNILIDRQRPHCEGDAELSAALQAAYKKAKRLTFGVLGYMFVLGQMWATVPLFMQFPPDDPSSPLPLVTITRVHKVHNHTLYSLAYLSECHTVLYWNFSSLGMDVFFGSVMIHVTGQLNILNIRLSRLSDGGAAGDLAHSSNFDKGSQQQKWNTHDSVSMYDEVRNCVRDHQEILRYLDFLENLMNPVPLAQFLLCVGGICLTLYQITFNPDDGGVIECILFLPIPALQIFIYCWAGHGIMEESEYVSFAVYSCRWPGADRRVTNLLRIVMSRAQKASFLTAGKVHPINRDTFLSLLNASYSFYTLLRQMKNLEEGNEATP
ncbi:odorant receptor Or2-like [Schistocerca serialis cubense]|uniref:odorant receptor Or2-like n=1 Tax=Schistocerca serialis cubense TaxID=2023355 RepID=UPI00214F2FFE|nr:odorant receptor Or2-like [Schistocerca serialis cubense]